LTFWYEFYYDVYPHKYQYGFKLRELHDRYGPIIRINPIHVHIHDHSYLDTIYASGNAHKRDRCSWAHHSGAKTFSGAMLEAMDHDLHKMRRNATSGFFSKRNVQVLEPLIIDTTNKLLARMKQDVDRDIGEGGKGIVNLNCAFAGMTMDIISEYCFGESMNSMEHPKYGKRMLDVLHTGLQIRPLARQFPWFFNWMFDLPPEYVAYLSPDIVPMNEFNAELLRKITKIMNFEDESGKQQGRDSIFHVIRDGADVKLPPEEKKPLRLMAESSVFMGAGTETTARTLAVTIYYLLKEKEIGKRLFEELKGVLPTRDAKVSLPQLELLPYLVSTSGVV
jgi:cytochrome P450